MLRLRPHRALLSSRTTDEVGAIDGEDEVAEVLVTFKEPVTGPGGEQFIARACGGLLDDGRWQGWIEFVSLDGSGVFRSPRETTQPNFTDVTYWATGLTPIYLEGALERTLRPDPIRTAPALPEVPAFDGPAPTPTYRPATADATEGVLDPFSIYRKGEILLRRELMALADWHLVNIIEAYELSERSLEDLAMAPSSELIEIIVNGVRETVATGR